VLSLNASHTTIVATGPKLAKLTFAGQVKPIPVVATVQPTNPEHPEVLAQQLKPKGAYRFFLQNTLRVAKWIESGLLPQIAYLVFAIRHPKAPAETKALKKGEYKHCFRTQPNSLTNRTYRRLYPRELGISVYGTARTQFSDDRLKDLSTLSHSVGEAIAKWGYFPVTGGGPGVMFDVCEGAKRQGGHTAAAAIPTLDSEPENIDFSVFDEFSVHKTFPQRLTGPNSFIHRSPRTLVLPGGIGTHRELLSVSEDANFNLTSFPAQKQVVILDPNGFYEGFKLYLHALVQSGAMSPHQLKAFVFVKTLAKAKVALFNPSVEWTKGIENKHHRSVRFHK
jgi:predicted Rossmann-fold nucleotide-binding protein